MFQQQRRNLQHVGDVVEPVALVVARQQFGDVDVQRQQIADRVGVFGAIQPVQRRAPGIHVAGRRAVERRLQPGRQPLQRVLIGTRHARRRHGPAMNFADHFFPHLGALANAVQAHFVEREICDFERLVVAHHAILIEQLALRDVRRNRLGSGRRNHLSGGRRGKNGGENSGNDGGKYARENSRKNATTQSRPPRAKTPLFHGF